MSSVLAHFRRQPLADCALAAVLLSMVALGGAFISQYGFDMHPCQMCYWQRFPYAGVMVVGMLALFAARNDPGVAATLLWLCALAFAVGTGLAVYHAGVEWEWWQGPTACSGGPLTEMTLEEIRQRLLSAATVSCAEAPFRFLGLSMAGWNAVYSAGCMTLMVWGLRLPRPVAEGKAQP